MYSLRASNYLRDGVPCHGRHARITGDLWQADLVLSFSVIYWDNTPDSKVHEANKGPIWGRQDPGGPHVGPMNLAIRDRTPITLTVLNSLEHMKYICIFLHVFIIKLTSRKILIYIFDIVIFTYLKMCQVMSHDSCSCFKETISLPRLHRNFARWSVLSK